MNEGRKSVPLCIPLHLTHSGPEHIAVVNEWIINSHVRVSHTLTEATANDKI